MKDPLNASRMPVPLLVGVDAAAFVAFVLVGLDRHSELATVDALARNLIPLLGAWFAIAVVLGCYRRPGARSLVLTWAVAVPVGLTLRTVWVGSPSEAGSIAIFFAVALAFTLLFLVAARGLAALLTSVLVRAAAPRT